MNRLRLIERTDDYESLEVWQVEHRREQKLDNAGFAGDGEVVALGLDEIEDDLTHEEAVRRLRLGIRVQIFHEHERIDEARKIDRRRCVARMHDGRCAPVEDSLMTYEGEDEDGTWEQPICFALPGGVTADWMPVVLK